MSTYMMHVVHQTVYNNNKMPSHQRCTVTETSAAEVSRCQWRFQVVFDWQGVTSY